MTTEALAPTAAEPAVRSGRCVQRCSELALVGSIPNMDATDERCIKRLMQRFYEQPLINNVHRGDYVESLVSHIFRTTPATIGSQRGPVATAS